MLKFLLVGESRVGKTCLLRRFTREAYSELPLTIGIDFESQKMDIDGLIVRLQLWDTAGQERYRSVTKSYYKNCDAFVVCFDLCNRESFRAIEKWIAEVQDFASEALVMLVGTKLDAALEGNRQVSSAEASQFVEERGFLGFVETSSKTGENVSNLFFNICKKVLTSR
jgi:small GTP-binding protein